jgi:nucleoside-diphosphate-sugar epimerase
VKKKILVTGCAGFIGSNLVDFFLKKNFKIIGIDNLSTGNIRFLNKALKKKKF